MAYEIRGKIMQNPTKIPLDVICEPPPSRHETVGPIISVGAGLQINFPGKVGGEKLTINP